MTTPNEATPIDTGFLKDLSDDPSEVREVVNLYIEQTGERIASLEKAVAAGSANDVMRLSHTCAGSSGMYGMVAIEPIFRELERLGRVGDLSSAPELYKNVCTEFSRIKAFWQAYQQTM
jgi:HPt (histidine-containing phosphotransfer) domain-containing protein